MTDTLNIRQTGYGWLLLAQVVLLASGPLFQAMTASHWSVAILYSIVMLIAIGASAPGRLRNTAIAAGAFSVAGHVGILFGFHPTLEWARLGGSSAFLFLTCALFLRDVVVRSHRVSANLLAGAVNVYVLLALGFGFLYALIHLVYPASLSGPPENMHLGEVLPYIYFSFVTITSLGYGDIVPKAELTMMLTSLEAVLGQLFIAVMVARLVALHVVHGQKP